jgi:hypothetical protein
MIALYFKGMYSCEILNMKDFSIFRFILINSSEATQEVYSFKGTVQRKLRWVESNVNW